MTKWILTAAVAALLACASGCLTTNLVKPRTLPPESYGELIGLQRRGAGKDTFIYRINGHTGAASGYYWVRPPARPDDGQPEVGRYENRDAVPAAGLEPVPVLHARDRRLAQPGTGDRRSPPDFRIVRLPDGLGRENHAYERWSPRHEEWLRLGSCAMGTKRYKDKGARWTLIFLPFAAAIDIFTLPFQLVGLFVYVIAKDSAKQLQRAATNAAVGVVLGRVGTHR